MKKVAIFKMGIFWVVASALLGSCSDPYMSVTKSKLTGTSGVPVGAITFATPSYNLAYGGTISQTATVSPSNAANKTVNWSSDNTEVAMVNPTTGLVTAGSTSGSANIKATAADGSGVWGTYAVCVSSSTILVQSISFGSSSLTNYVGKSSLSPPSVTVLPADATNPALTWTCDGTAVTSVDSSGNYSTGSTKGIAGWVKATATDGSGVYNTFTVNTSTNTQSTSLTLNYTTSASSRYILHLSSANGPTSVTLSPTFLPGGTTDTTYTLNCWAGWSYVSVSSSTITATALGVGYFTVNANDGGSSADFYFQVED